MSDDERPSDPESTRVDSADLSGDADDVTRQDGGTPDDSSTPKRLGDFDLLREIGRGGMGVVYEAHQISLNRRVALKVLPPGLGLTEQAVKRFEREAQAAAKLHHTNIVPVHAIGQADGSHFYAMELIEGQPLSNVLRDLSGGGSNPLLNETVTRLGGTEPITSKPETNQADSSITSLSDTQSGSRKWFDTVAKLVADVADALEYAHDRGVIHRDIKPANLMLSKEGRLCITDFGLARVAQEPGMTVSGSLLGTPAYMSPEQITAGRVKLDHRTDVYSLGTVLYEMLAQQRPFPGESREVVFSAILTKEPRPPRRFNPRVPLDLETIALKAMEKDPDRRYATAGELAQDLKQYLGGGLIAARRAGPLRRSVKYMRRHPLAATIFIAAVVVAAVGGVAWRTSSRAAAVRAERSVRDAQLALGKGNYRDGLALVEGALAVAPNLPEARLLRAQLLIVLGRAVEAVGEAREMIARDPDNLAAHLILVSAAGSVPDISRDEQLRLVEERFPPEILETADAYYQRSVLAQDEAEGIALLDRVLDLDPGHHAALASRANRLTRLKRFREALNDCDRLISVRPNDASGRRLKADVYFANGENKRAKAEIDRAIGLDPGDPASFIFRGSLRCTGDRKSMDEALADMDTAVRLDPENGYSYYKRTWCKFQFGQFESALDDARRTIALGSDEDWATSAQFQMGEILYRLGREEEAGTFIEEFERRIADWPDEARRSRAYQSLANLLSRLGEPEQALPAADKAVELSGSRWGPYITRARIRGSLNDEQGKQADCDVVAEKEISQPHQLHERAINLRDVCERYELALEDLDRVVEIAPEWPFGYLERGWTKVQAGRSEEGLLDYDRTTELAPGLLRAHNARGFVLTRLGRWEEALKGFDDAIALEPNRFAYCNRALALSSLGRMKDTKATLERCLEYDPSNATTLGNLGLLSSQLGETEDALSFRLRALEFAPENPFVHVGLAGDHAVLGDCKEAARALQAAQDLGVEDQTVRFNFINVLLLDMHYFCPEQSDLSLALQHLLAMAESERWDKLPMDGTFGIVWYRSGKYEDARAALRKAVETQGEEEVPESLFFLSMVESRLGHSVEAGVAYDRGMKIIEQQSELALSPVMGKIREEAASLLSR